MDNNKFNGNECLKCGSTLRYINGHKCVCCSTTRSKIHDKGRKRNTPENKEKVAARQRKWQKNNPAKRRMHDANKRARMRNAICCLKADDWQLYVDRELGGYGLCVYCGDTANQWDHVIALANGGRHCIANIAPACGKCNNSKNDKPLELWLPGFVVQPLAVCRA